MSTEVSPLMRPPPPEQQGSDEQLCRICFSTDNKEDMIVPCRCAGSQRWVHRECLDEWRAQEHVANAFSRCPTCKFHYIIKEEMDEEPNRRLRFYAYVARDSAGVFGITQVLVMLVAALIHALDKAGEVPKLYPKDWAQTHTAHMSIGPYYITGLLAVLAFMGLATTCAAFCSGDRNRSRTCLDSPGGCCCYGCPCDCFGGGGGVSAGAEGAGCLLVLVGILVVIGVFVAIFMGYLMMQRIMQRHLKVLHLRGEAKRFVVMDLQNRQDLVDSLV